MYNKKNIAKKICYNSHDCCTYFKCPHCGKDFSTWDTYRKKDETHCPECGEEIELAPSP